MQDPISWVGTGATGAPKDIVFWFVVEMMMNYLFQLQSHPYRFLFLFYELLIIVAMLLIDMSVGIIIVVLHMRI